MAGFKRYWRAKSPCSPNASAEAAAQARITSALVSPDINSLPNRAHLVCAALLSKVSNQTKRRGAHPSFHTTLYHNLAKNKSGRLPIYFYCLRGIVLSSWPLFLSPSLTDVNAEAR